MSPGIGIKIGRLGIGSGGSSGWTAQYTDTEIQVLIDDGYIPIASPADLNNIRTVYSGASTKIFAKGTKWETAAINTLGIDGKYVQTCDINLDWTDSAILVNYNAANTMLGDMKTLAKTTLSKLVIGGANVISGDFNKIPYYVTHCDIQGANTMSTYAGTSAAKFPMDGLNTLISIPVTTGLNEAGIDSLINDLADITWAGANKVLTLTGAHAIPSAASAASIVVLQAQGVVVTVNS